MTIQSQCRRPKADVARRWLEFGSLAWRVVLSALLSVCVVPGRAQTARENAQLIDSLNELPMQLGTLARPQAPADNPQTPRKVELGRRLFFDNELSRDRSMSCA